MRSWESEPWGDFLLFGQEQVTSSQCWAGMGGSSLEQDFPPSAASCLKCSEGALGRFCKPAQKSSLCISSQARELWGAELTNEYAKPSSEFIIKGSHPMVNSFFYYIGSEVKFWVKMLEERHPQVLPTSLPAV